MKKRFLLAIAALTFTATLFAQDYMVIDNYNGKFARYDLDFIKQAYFINFEAQGSGTESDPFNVAAANAKCKEQGETASTTQYYIKGIVAVTNRAYTNGEVYLNIADDSVGINRMEAFLYNADGTIPANYEFKRGDEIVVYGSLFLSGTMSIANGRLISVNGKELGYNGSPTGSGTAADPYNVAAIINETANLSDGEFYKDGENIYVTGIVTQTTDISAQYGNATYYISDDANGSNKFYVYRGKMLDGANVAAETDLEVGDSVTVCGKIKNWRGTNEFDQGNYLTFIKKGKGSNPQDTPGTAEAPLTVTQALAFIDNLEADIQSSVGYVKGIIVSISEISTQYGNATYYISDNGQNENTLLVYRGYSLGGEKFTSEDEIKVGDQVVVTGKLVNFKGNTKEFVQGSSIYSLNGQTAGGDEIKTVSIAQFLAAEVSNDVWYKLKGKVKNLKEGDKYGNFYLEDENDSVYVYGLLSEKGGEKKKFQELVAAKGIKEGSTITIIGNRGEYNGVVEVMNAYFVSIEGDGGNGTAESPYSVPEAIAAGYSNGVYVKAFIVGNVTGQTLAEGAHFDTTGEAKSNLLIAASKDETDVTKCMPIQLPSGDIRNALNLVDNPTLYKKEVTLYGDIAKYFGTTGLKSVSYAILDGNEIGTKPNSGGNNPSGNTGTLENPLTASQAYDIVAAMEGGKTSDEDYYVKGKISSIKYTFSAQYGTATFNISDDGNTGNKDFIAYSCYYFGNQPWVEGNTQIQVGDEVVVCGKVVNYQGNTPEFASKKNYLVKLNSQTSASRQYSK